jgi:hypothetical protein
VARRPSVFVRPLSMDEGRKLQRITRTAKDPVRMRRALVVLMSGQGQTVRDITGLLQVSADYVRDVIHAFNERGFDALDPEWSGGRPRTIGNKIREWICLIARTSPAECGITAPPTPTSSPRCAASSTSTITHPPTAGAAGAVAAGLASATGAKVVLIHVTDVALGIAGAAVNPTEEETAAVLERTLEGTSSP